MDAIGLRPEEAADEAFLQALYASTRAAEMALAPWSDAQKWAFLRGQFRLQAAHYRTHYADADFCIVTIGTQAVGRLYVLHQPHATHLIDIALLPEWRGRGLGSELLRQLLEHAVAAGSRLTARVERNNPARRLYERLGFRVVADEGVYLLIEWSGAASEAAKAHQAGESQP